jgi:rhodanese-related sulfurtransferase
MGVLKEINSYDLAEEIKSNKILLLDVRESNEFQEEHIEGALNYPLSNFDPESVRALCQNNPHKTLVLQCAAGVRSAKAATKLHEAGWGDLLHLKGGLNSWKQSGLSLDISTGNINSKAKNITLNQITIPQQVKIIVGTLVVTGIISGATVHGFFYLISFLTGIGLIYSGASGDCKLEQLLNKLPWNK